MYFKDLLRCLFCHSVCIQTLGNNFIVCLCKTNRVLKLKEKCPAQIMCLEPTMTFTCCWGMYNIMLKSWGDKFQIRVLLFNAVMLEKYLWTCIWMASSGEQAILFRYNYRLMFLNSTLIPFLCQTGVHASFWCYSVDWSYCWFVCLNWKIEMLRFTILSVSVTLHTFLVLQFTTHIVPQW